MRILILSQYFWPENFRINDIASELAGRGHEICVVTGLPNYPSGAVFADYRRDPTAFARWRSVEIVRVPMVSRGSGSLRLVANYLSFAVSAATVGVWKLRRHRFDRMLVFQPSPATIGIASVVLRRAKGVETIFWVQDLWPDTLHAIGAVRSERLLSGLEMFVRWVYAHCDHVLAQSKAFLPRLRQQAPQDVPVSYLPNWADTPSRSAAAVATEPEVGSRPFTIFYLGNLGEAQDLPAILDAASLLADRQDVRWHFVGEGRMAAWLRAEIDRRNLGCRVSMLGSFPPEEMPRFHAAADALLVSLKAGPLFSMTVPSKIQAYLATGVPIVGMLDGEGARVINDSGAGLTCPAGDSHALADAILHLAAMPASARASFGRAGRCYSRRHFSFPVLATRLEAVLQDPSSIPDCTR